MFGKFHFVKEQVSSVPPCKLCCLRYLSSILPRTIVCLLVGLFFLWTMLLNLKGPAVQRERQPVHLHVVLELRQLRQPTTKTQLC